MSRAYIPRDEFVKGVKTGTTPAGVLRKQYIAESITKAEDGGTRTRQFIVSTGSVDRDNDAVSAKGWKLDNYRKNPVVLFAHDYSSLPIGKCTAIKIVGGQLIATAEFADHDMANTVLHLVDGGFLNATSVGFRPLKFQLNDQRRGVDFEEQELLEFSIVPVPANPEALIVAREFTGDVALLKDWAAKTIKTLQADDDEHKDADGIEQTEAILDGILKHFDITPAADATVATKAALADAAVQALKSLAKGKNPFAKPDDGGTNDMPDDQQDDDTSEDGKKPKKADAPVDDDDEEDEGAKKPPPFKSADVAAHILRALKGGCECMAMPDHDPKGCSCCSSSGNCQCSDCAAQNGRVKRTKAGRMLSTRNESKIRAAHGHLSEVLAAMPNNDTEECADDDDESVLKDGEVVLDFDAQQDDDIDLSPDEVKTVLAEVLGSSVKSTLETLIKETTQTEINRMRGRLD